MFTTNLYNMFEAFDKINNISGIESVSEISIHQNQISFAFDSKNIIYMENINEIEQLVNPITITDITLFENALIASCRDLQALEKKKDNQSNPLCLFKAVIEELAKTVCACPALEFVISGSFIKCFLDKPNILLEDVAKLDTIFDSKGVLELNGQRPYVLYVRDEIR